MLQPITIKQYITLNKRIDLKQLMKMFLYKMGLLHICIGIYYKFKPIALKVSIK